MGIFDFLKRQPREEEIDPLKDLRLDKLKPGYMVDYDLKTWQVTAHHRYDYGDGYWGDEWELTSGREKIFLEREADDEVEWSVSRLMPLGMIEPDVKKHIIEHEDPPNQIVVKGKTYYLDDSGPAYFLKNGGPERVGFIYWTFYDEEGDEFVTIEQWDEEEFEASHGVYVEEYQFTNILPSEKNA